MLRVLMLFAAIVCVLLAPAPAYAQAPSDVAQTPIVDPVWVVRPPTTLLSSFGGEDFRPSVGLNCRVAGETLANCRAVEPTPESFLRAALEAASVTRMASRDGAGQPTDGREIVVRIGFAIPVAIDPPPPPSPALITRPRWLELPRASVFYRLYPPAALAADVEGTANLDCLVGSNGSLSCAVLSDEPAGMGFAEAALMAARDFRMAPQSLDGQPTAGGRYQLRVRFRLPTSDVPPPTN